MNNYLHNLLLSPISYEKASRVI